MRCDVRIVKNNENLNDDCAGCAEAEPVPVPVMDRTQVLDSINAAYRSRGAPVASLEDGQTIYWKRKSGKVASFFRCLLR